MLFFCSVILYFFNLFGEGKPLSCPTNAVNTIAVGSSTREKNRECYPLGNFLFLLFTGEGKLNHTQVNSGVLEKSLMMRNKGRKLLLDERN